MKKLNKFEIGWLSSAIDGEGSIGFDKKTRVLRVAVYNTNKEFIDYAQKLLNGNIFIRPKTEIRKVLYRVEIGGKENIINILQQIIPYLLIKKNIAIEVLEMAKNKGIYGVRGCRVCGEKHYSKGWCSKHWYQYYGKKYHKNWRKSKI